MRGAGIGILALVVLGCASPSDSHRRIEVRVPAAFHLQKNPRESGTLRVGYEDADAEVVTLETHTGFDLGMVWDTGDGSMGEWGGREVGGGSSYLTVEPRPDGAIDSTHTVTIYEYPPMPRETILATTKPPGSRVLWSRSYRVAFSAAEIEALRR